MKVSVLITSCALAFGSAGPAAAQQPTETYGTYSRQAKPGQTPSGRVDSVGSELQGFSIVLVVGDLQGTTTADNVPAAARKALNDMKDFLPYKSYRLLDAHWILCCGTSTTTGLLRGAEGNDYEFALAASRLGGGRVTVKFTMRDDAATPRAASTAASTALVNSLESRIQAMRSEREQLAKQRDQTRNADIRERLTQQIRELESRIGAADREVYQSVRAQGGRSGAKIHGGRAIFDTSFAMDIGETVVVGTSRVGGDKALIALLTAARRNEGTR